MMGLDDQQTIALLQIIGIIFISIAAIAILLSLMNMVNGSAIEERLEPTWQEKMLERTREWNIMKAINETLALSEQYK